jgi:Tfp pilus assembly protein PilW
VTRVGLAGLTILEALVTTSILMVVLLGVYLVYETSEATYWRGRVQTDIHQEVRASLERIQQELRMAGYDPSGTGQAAVQGPTSTSVSFVTDVGGNNVSDLVTYDWDATAKGIRRTVSPWTGTGWGPATVTSLALNVDSLTFQYFPSAAVPGLNRIQITILTSKPVPRQPTQQHQVATDVFLRNL